MELLRENVLQLDTADFIIKEDATRYRSNRDFKDGMFRLLFRDKERALELFNALEGTHYIQTEQMEIVTLEDAIFNRFVNDLSFQYDLKFVSAVEHQSTWSENLPLREMLYMSRVYEKILDFRSAYKKQLYKIPVPHMFMLYNGEADYPAEQIQRLSDAFLIREESPFAEFLVKVININYEKRHPILERSPTLKGYAVFVERVRRNMRYQSMDRDEAIRDAITSCVKDGILADFLEKHGSEVYNMLFTEITEEDIIEIRVEEEVEERLEKAVEKRVEETVKKRVEETVEKRLEEAVRKRVEETMAEKLKRVIKAMLIEDKSVEEIYELTDVPMEKILEIKNGLGA